MAVSSVPRPGHGSSDNVFFISPTEPGNWHVYQRIASVPYSKVDNEHLDIHTDQHLAVRVLVYLACPRAPYKNPDSSVVAATVSEGAIAAHFGVSVRTIKRSMKTITEWGYVRTRRRQISGYNGKEFVWDYHVYRSKMMNPHWVKAQAQARQE